MVREPLLTYLMLRFKMWPYAYLKPQTQSLSLACILLSPLECGTPITSLLEMHLEG